MGAKSKRKGKVGEREAAKAVSKALRCEARRGAQHSGSPDSPDIQTSIPYLHFEVKRCEKLDLYAALDQARRDAGANVPVVLHRKNRREWVVICLLDDLEFLADALNAAMAATKPTETVGEQLARAAEAEAGRTRFEGSD